MITCTRSFYLLLLILSPFEPDCIHGRSNFDHFDSPTTKIVGKRLLDVLESIKNGLSGVENGGIQIKIIIVSLIVSKIAHFRPFYPFWRPF